MQAAGTARAGRRRHRLRGPGVRGDLGAGPSGRAQREGGGGVRARTVSASRSDGAERASRCEVLVDHLALQPPNSPAEKGLSRFMGWETEAQSGHWACPRPPGRLGQTQAKTSVPLLLPVAPEPRGQLSRGQVGEPSLGVLIPFPRVPVMPGHGPGLWRSGGRGGGAGSHAAPPVPRVRGLGNRRACPRAQGGGRRPRPDVSLREEQCDQPRQVRARCPPCPGGRRRGEDQAGTGSFPRFWVRQPLMPFLCQRSWRPCLLPGAWARGHRPVDPLGWSPCSAARVTACRGRGSLQSDSPLPRPLALGKPPPLSASVSHLAHVQGGHGEGHSPRCGVRR